MCNVHVMCNASVMCHVTQITCEWNGTTAHMRVTRVLRSHLGDIDLPTLPPRSKELRPIEAYAKTESMLLKLYAVQRLGEDIRDHLFAWAVNKLNLTCCSNVTDIMILYFNVLVALVDRLILDRVDRALVIRIDSNTRRVIVPSHVCQEAAEPHIFFCC